MPGKMTTPLRVIGEGIQEGVTAKKKVIVNTFCYAGEMCIEEARNGGNYIDRTGNLRSSIGYAVLWDGKVIQQECVDKTKNGDSGVSEGMRYLQSRCEKASKKGIVLIVTAGMHYAEYVEAKGYVVLSSAELKAPKIVKRLLLQLGFKLK